MHPNYLGCMLKCRFLGQSQRFRVRRPGTESFPQSTLKILNPIRISSFHAILNTPCSFFWIVWILGQTFTNFPPAMPLEWAPTISIPSAILSSFHPQPCTPHFCWSCRDTKSKGGAKNRAQESPQPRASNRLWVEGRVAGKPKLLKVLGSVVSVVERGQPSQHPKAPCGCHTLQWGQVSRPKDGKD